MQTKYGRGLKIRPLLILLSLICLQSCCASEVRPPVRDTTFTEKKVIPLSMSRKDTLDCLRDAFVGLKYKNEHWTENGGSFELVYKEESEFQGMVYIGEVPFAIYDDFTYSYQISVAITDDQVIMYISNRINNDETIPITLDLHVDVQKVLDLCIEPNYCGEN
jgi:hypothetical protein